MPDLEYLIPTRRIKRRAVVTINNTSSYATANPHVQLIKISHYALEYILGIGLDPNAVPFFTYFYDPNQNTELYSWYDSFDGTYHYWWVKTAQIGANSTYNLYLIYDPTAIQLDGNYVGINPYYAYYVRNLVSSYGQYDNGSNVFYYYWNFSGTSLPSGWSATTNGGSYSVNNGLTLTETSSASGCMGLVYNLSTIPSTGFWVRYYYKRVTCCGCGSGNDMACMIGNSLNYPWNGNNYGYTMYGCGGTCGYLWYDVNGSRTFIASVSTTCVKGMSGYMDFTWTQLSNSILNLWDSGGRYFMNATSTEYTLSIASQLEIGTCNPNSGTNSFTIFPLLVADAPLSYSIVNNTPVIVPYVSFAPAD